MSEADDLGSFLLKKRKILQSFWKLDLTSIVYVYYADMLGLDLDYTLVYE